MTGIAQLCHRHGAQAVGYVHRQSEPVKAWLILRNPAGPPGM